MNLLEAKKISKVYTDMASPVWVLKDLDFKLNEGDLVGIFGASGAGKSTFLHVMGGIDLPTDGRVCFKENDLKSMGSDELAAFRNKQVGFVFQFYHLLTEFTALENVMLPALIARQGRKDARDAASEALEAVGLGGRLSHRPGMLSGGEQQRVALARAAVLKPPMILADEPTGNLDHETGEQVFEYLLSLHKRQKTAMVIVTHNRELLGRLPKSFELEDGRLHEIF